MITKIFAGPATYDLRKLYQSEEDEYIIGCDQGALLLSLEQITFDLALGDFDSVSPSELELIKKYAKEVKTFPKTKDYTDSFLSIKYALELDSDEIILYGGLGGRVDHTLANIMLLQLGNIVMINENTKMYILDPGTYDIKNNYQYISFFAIEDTINLTLKGFKYELNNITLDTLNPLCISNEGEGTLTFQAGTILVIHSNEI